MNQAVSGQNPYRRLRRVGRGGFADVFEAERRDQSGDRVALKVPRNVPLAAERLAREINVQSNLVHRNVMPILDAAEDGSWFVMPLAEGNLEDLWEAGALGSDPEALAVDVVDAISQGLEAAHDAEFVHRDISPRNILALRESGSGDRRWVVADWGLVRRPAGQTTRRLTSAREGLGTAGFAAPETWDDAHSADHRADIYSLGRVVAWLLTDTWPQENLPLLPTGPLRGLVHECTQLDRDRRIDSMARVRERLAELLAPRPLSVSGQAQALVERAIDNNEAIEAEIFGLAAAHEDDGALYLDELARMPLAHVHRFTRASPHAAAAAAESMLRHLAGDWGQRDFSYANVPLRFAFDVLTELVDTGQLVIAEDVAASFFAVDKEWDRWKQKPLTLRWLAGLSEAEGVAMANALRRAGAQDYYASGLKRERVASRTLAAELGL
jgi:serine/threonine protein kinase